MREILIEEAKKVELGILCAFAEFCEKHDLTYYLAYGTLIGAIRHKGFIPWDDDIDVQMKRDDYNKLIETFNVEMVDTPFRLIDIHLKEANHSYVKIVDTRTVKYEYRFKNINDTLGVDIDVFPLNGCPSDIDEYNKWYKKLYKMYKRHYYKKMRVFDFKPKSLYHLFKKISMGCLKPSVEKIFDKAAKLHAMYPCETSEYIGCFESCFGGKNGTRLKKEWYDGTVDVDFEGLKFKAPKNYHEVLTAYFGDYMTPPPVEQQVTHHGNNMFHKDGYGEK